VPTKAKPLRWAATIPPATLRALVDRTTLLAKQVNVPRARKLRVDSTSVQTSIHHLIESGLLDDGVRVLDPLIRQARPQVQALLARVRDGFRSRLRISRWLVQRVHRVSRLRGAEAEAQRRALYRQLLDVTRRTERQAQRVRTALQRLKEGRPRRSSPCSA
jgi:transposase, IS5 family